MFILTSRSLFILVVEASYMSNTTMVLVMYYGGEWASLDNIKNILLNDVIILLWSYYV